MFEQFIGTKPVEERHRIDTAALERYLGFRIATVEQFKGGQSNPTYRLSASDGRKFVLRRKPPGKLLPSAHAVDREYRVIAALHPTGFPVARPYSLCEDESVIGTAFYVMDYVEGRVLWDQSLPGMTKSERRAIWDELNRVIALLHTLDYRALGIPSEAEYVRMYCRRTGREAIEQSHWDFYMAYNLFRIAAILQGIAKRVVDGTAASDHARDAGSRARPMAELGWQQVEKILRRAA